MSTAPRHLEELRKIVQAAHDTEYSFPGAFTEGITAGLQIALNAIDAQLKLVRDFDAIVGQSQ